MSTTIPSYPNPCLAADAANNAIYLVGVSPAIQGRLEVNYVSMVDVNAPTSSSVGSQVNTGQWSSGAPKACFIHPANTYANPVLSTTLLRCLIYFRLHRSCKLLCTPNKKKLCNTGTADQLTENAYASPLSCFPHSLSL